MALEKATLASGCFWCAEAVFARAKGVKKVEVGYTGGAKPDPTYKDVCTGKTGHAEAAQVTFDPEETSYEDLLRLFFESHDPTTLNRQGADVGTQYRSAIFFHDEAQKGLALKVKAEVQKKLRKPVVTEIVPLETFYPAEDYHQGYFDKNPGAPYCAMVIAPKLEKLGLEDGPPPEGATEEEWRRKLAPEQYRVLRMGGTEPPFTGKWLENKEKGVYTCAACGAPLFSSDAKFNSGTGWPSFDSPAARESVELRPDTRHGMARVEVRCRRCGSHLGHVFDDGPPETTGKRYCINSVCLGFQKRPE